jgi:hypothetical protein
MSMVRRLALTAPDHLVEEISRLRQERDNLKDALSIKLSEHVRSIGVGAQDILVVKKPGSMSRELAVEVIETLTERLRSKYGWDGVIVLQDSIALDLLKDPEAAALYAILKRRFGDAQP